MPVSCSKQFVVRIRRIAVVPLSVWVTACGSGSTPSAPAAPSVPAAQTAAPPPPPAAPPTVTVSADGLDPIELTISVGSTVLFVNKDMRVHDFAGGPDPSRRECPEIDVAGFIVPGQTKETGVFNTARTCDYHDHAQFLNPAFTGRIVIR